MRLLAPVSTIDDSWISTGWYLTEFYFQIAIVIIVATPFPARKIPLPGGWRSRRPVKPDPVASTRAWLARRTDRANGYAARQWTQRRPVRRPQVNETGGNQILFMRQP
jgi:hypothetical protein